VLALFADFHTKLPGLIMMAARVRPEEVAGVYFFEKQHLP